MTRSFFEIPSDLKDKLKKYTDIERKVFGFDLGSLRIVFEDRFQEYLSADPATAKKFFENPISLYIVACRRLQIDLRPVKTVIFIADESDRPIADRMKDRTDGSEFGLILFPPIQYAEHLNLFTYWLLHELGHCWPDIELPKDDDPSFPRDKCELYADLVAFCTLKEIFPPHSRAFREVIKNDSYLQAPGSKHFGKQLLRKVLDSPELTLREFVRENIRKLH